jgi:hypothetical protein
MVRSWFLHHKFRPVFAASQGEPAGQVSKRLLASLNNETKNYWVTPGARLRSSNALPK